LIENIYAATSREDANFLKKRWLKDLEKLKPKMESHMLTEVLIEVEK
jgi:hypothetical protein